jgi:hypothetical protein
VTYYPFPVVKKGAAVYNKKDMYKFSEGMVVKDDSIGL